MKTNNATSSVRLIVWITCLFCASSFVNAQYIEQSVTGMEFRVTIDDGISYSSDSSAEDLLANVQVDYPNAELGAIGDYPVELIETVQFTEYDEFGIEITSYLEAGDSTTSSEYITLNDQAPGGNDGGGGTPPDDEECAEEVQADVRLFRVAGGGSIVDLPFDVNGNSPSDMYGAEAVGIEHFGLPVNVGTSLPPHASDEIEIEAADITVTRCMLNGQTVSCEETSPNWTSTGWYAWRKVDVIAKYYCKLVDSSDQESDGSSSGDGSPEGDQPQMVTIRGEILVDGAAADSEDEREYTLEEWLDRSFLNSYWGEDSSGSSLLSSLDDTIFENDPSGDPCEPCAACTDSAAGSCPVDSGTGSIRIEIPTGSMKRGGGSGELKFYQQTPGSHLFNPRVLQNQTRGAQVLRGDDHAIRQVATFGAFHDVKALSPHAFQVRTFKRPENFKIDPETGYYPVPNVEPLRTVTISNPEPDAPEITKLQLTEKTSGEEKNGVFHWDAELGLWEYHREHQGLVEVLTKTDDPDTGLHIKIRTVRAEDGSNARTTREEYQVINGRRWMTKRIQDPGGAALTETIEYHQDPADKARYGKVKQIIQPNGSWVRHEYDDSGKLAATVRPYKDSPVGAPIEEAQAEYSSERSLKADEEFYHPLAQLSESWTTVLGVETRRSFNLSSFGKDGGRISVSERAHSPAAKFGDPKNIRSVSYYYPNKRATAESGKLRQQIGADGRSTRYEYAWGDYMGVAAMPGDFDAAEGAVMGDLYGTRDLQTTRIEGTVENPEGVVGKGTKTVTVTSMHGHSLLSQTFLKTDDGWSELSWSANEYDDLGRRILARNQTGITGEWRYSKCCDQVEWERDANGMVTTYQYDDADRVKMRAQQSPGRAAIETWYTYNVHGQTTETRVVAGDLVQVTKRSYDELGRLASSIDAAGLETKYAYDIAGRKNTTILPGGATRITESYLDGRQKSTTGTSVVAQYSNYGVDTEKNELWTESRQAREDSPRWTRSYSNFLGQNVRSERPGFGEGVIIRSQQEYDEIGRAISSQSAFRAPNSEFKQLGAATLTLYNEEGEVELSGQDIDGNQQLQAASADRVGKSESEIVKLEDGNWWRISKSWAFPKENDGTPVALGESRQRLTGYDLMEHGEDGKLGQLVSESVSIQPGTKNQEPRTTSKTYRNRQTATTTTVTAANGIESIQVTQGGLVQTVTTREIENPQSSISIRYSYDSLGRRIAVVDPRTGKSQTEYDPKTGRVLAEIDAADNRTEYRYDHTTGQLKTVINAAKKKQQIAYNKRGQKSATWGESDYPLSYEYDDYGQLVKLITFQQNPNSSAPNRAQLLGSVDATQQTRWIYDEATGLLNRKEYADGKGTDYAYTPAGQLLERKWARGDKSVYAYNEATGQIRKVENISVDQRTSAVKYSYTRTGAIQEVIQQLPATEAHPEAEVVKYNYTHNDYGQVTEEHFERNRRTDLQVRSKEPLATHSIKRSYTHLGQPASMVFDCPECDVPHPINYEWDALGRLAAVESDLAGRFEYGYHEQSPSLLASMTSPVHQVAYRYENARNLITEVQNVALGEDRRTKFQLRSNEAPAESEPASTQPAAEPRTVSHYHYTNDTLGRRVARHQHGEAFADQPRWIEYAYNDRSEVTGATYFSEEQGTAASRRPEPVANFAYEFDAIGNRKSAAAEVSGESWTLSSHQIEYQANAINQYEEISVSSEPSVIPSYDIDGNLLTDKSFSYEWNAQNRLAAVEAPNGLERHEYQYDYIGRRIGKRSYARAAETENWNLTTENLFAYDGWNLISEITQSPNHQVTQSHYTWGRDLSGSMQGAGGVGGLLAISSGEVDVADSPSIAYPAYDANGNITQLIAADGDLGAKYEYSPFGEQLKAEGELAGINPIGFSTKYDDPETRMLYYGFRYYNSSTGRWPSRDPIEERGGENLYGFVNNRILQFIDYLGTDPKGLAKLNDTVSDGEMGYAFPIWFQVELKDYVQVVVQDIKILFKGDKVSTYRGVHTQTTVNIDLWSTKLATHFPGPNNNFVIRDSASLDLTAVVDYYKENDSVSCIRVDSTENSKLYLVPSEEILARAIEDDITREGNTLILVPYSKYDRTEGEVIVENSEKDIEFFEWLEEYLKEETVVLEYSSTYKWDPSNKALPERIEFEGIDTNRP